MKKVLCTTLALVLACAPLTACAEAPSAESPSLPAEEEETPVEPTVPEDTEGSEDATMPEDTTQPEQGTPPVEEEETPVESEPPQASEAQYILVLKSNLNIRTGASTSNTSLGQLEEGTLLQYIRTVNGWHETYYKNRVAYVSASSAYTTLFSLAQTDERTENVIDQGLKYLGTAYVYGAVRSHDGEGNKLQGFTSQKFDCSSLMQYIFYLGADTLLGTTTRTQVLQGSKVTGELERGDLLFFTNDSRYYNTGIERVGHVALYLGGNYILHTASDVAKIEQVSAKRWSYYLHARRFF